MISSKTRRRALLIGLGLAALYLLLMVIPDPEPTLPARAQRQPFVWNQDERWKGLERRFVELRAMDCASLKPRLDSGRAKAMELIGQLETERFTPDDSVLIDLEQVLFGMAPIVAVCPEHVSGYLTLMARMRTALKDQSLLWDMNAVRTRQRMYRLLYGGRAASEEALLQAPIEDVPHLVDCYDEPSMTPQAEVLGTHIHSGDILVSRGGAPTSALIARGNDYPGNFSHVAIAFVDSISHEVRVIESHIERGVAVASFAEYLTDTKLRIMILRLRSDLPAMVADPMLPHRAAELALNRARVRHTPYDFAMDTRDTSGMFCSEVVSSAYNAFGVTLWMGMSTISSAGVAAWLADFGVRHFETQEPSDLEYDPQLRVVAEWRDPRALLKDHMDNAIIESLLEGAEEGERIPVRLYLLPVARAAKLYSMLLNRLGEAGPVPEGMSATSSLRHLWLVDRHAVLREAVVTDVERFRQAYGYTPPYWELLKMARRAKAVQ